MNLPKNNFQTKNKRIYDLEERTYKFAEGIINIVKKLKENSVNSRLINQIVGSASSIGANYCEANEAESKQDFIHKIGIAKKETKETQYWLKLIKISNPEISNQLKIFQSECQELLLIFSSIIKTSKLYQSLKIDHSIKIEN